MAASEEVPDPDPMHMIFHSRPIMNCELCIMHWNGFPHGGPRRIQAHAVPEPPSSRKENNDKSATNQRRPAWLPSHSAPGRNPGCSGSFITAPWLQPGRQLSVASMHHSARFPFPVDNGENAGNHYALTIEYRHLGR